MLIMSGNEGSPSLSYLPTPHELNSSVTESTRRSFRSQLLEPYDINERNKKFTPTKIPIDEIRNETFPSIV